MFSITNQDNKVTVLLGARGAQDGSYRVSEMRGHSDQRFGRVWCGTYIFLWAKLYHALIQFYFCFDFMQFRFGRLLVIIGSLPGRRAIDVEGIPASGDSHLILSRPRLVPACPKVCTMHVREPLRFSKKEVALAPAGRTELLSDIIVLSFSFSKSTPPQNRQLNTSVSNDKP